MVRRSWTPLAGMLLAFSGAALTADKPDDKSAEKAPAGTWKITRPLQDKSPAWVIRLESKDGKWTGKVLAQSEAIGRSDLSGLSVQGGVLRFTIKAGERRYGFEAKVPAADADKILGTLSLRHAFGPVEMERTTLTGLEPTDLNKDI